MSLPPSNWQWLPWRVHIHPGPRSHCLGDFDQDTRVTEGILPQREPGWEMSVPWKERLRGKWKFCNYQGILWRIVCRKQMWSI